DHHQGERPHALVGTLAPDHAGAGAAHDPGLRAQLADRAEHDRVVVAHGHVEGDHTAVARRTAGACGADGLFHGLDGVDGAVGGGGEAEHRGGLPEKMGVQKCNN
ncbi:MAG: hypothetical protein ACK56I_02540, partial [bacterium]